MDKPTVGKMATVAKPITREQFDEAIEEYCNDCEEYYNCIYTDERYPAGCPSKRIANLYADQQKAIIDRMTKHISSTCICCPILGIGTCPRDAEQCPETVRRYFAEGK